MALDLKGVGLVYGVGDRYASRALAGVDLAVTAGELVLVLGATGSGKSTLLRVAAGLLKPTEGTVTADGSADTGPLAADPARRTGLVFQDPERQLFADTVLDDVAFGPRNLGVDDAELVARAAMEGVGLDPAVFGPRNPFTLSGGEARRAAIAGVPAMRPRYLLLDEPTAGLDSLGRQAVIESIRAARTHAGILLVTHDAEEFLAEADRVVVLQEGRVTWACAAADLVADPAPLYAAGLAAPDVLAVQMLARDRGTNVGAFTLDPLEAARRLAMALRGGTASGAGKVAGA